jgi:protein involved in ribonucleotide reduction
LSVTQTRSTTQTSTVPKIVYVTRKVQADFLAIMDTYGYFSEDYAKKLIADIRHFLDEEVVDKVKFVWTESGGNRALGRPWACRRQLGGRALSL